MKKDPSNPNNDLVIKCKSEFIPYRGLKLFRKNGKSIVLHFVTITRKDAKFFTDSKLLELASAVQRFGDAASEIAEGHDATVIRCEDGTYQREPISLNARVISEGDFPSFVGKYVYKYVSQQAYDAWFSKGCFRLGDLAGYRELEKEGHVAGDRFEGSTSIWADIEENYFFGQVTAGADYLVFSAVAHEQSYDVMSLKFGPVLLRFDVRTFANAVRRELGSRFPEVRSVAYSDLKVRRWQVVEKREISDLPQVTDRFVERIENLARRSSLFSKPFRFHEEQEIRLAFQMSSDVNKAAIIRIPDFKRFMCRIR